MLRNSIDKVASLLFVAFLISCGTGYTEGSIVAVDVHSAGLGGQLFVVKGYGDKEFGAPGDSGSLVW